MAVLSSDRPDYRRAREWRSRSDFSGALPEGLAEATGLDPLTLRVCLTRGWDTPAKIKDAFEPKLEKLTDPMTIKDMGCAVELLAQARAAGETLLVFGDYDVDGTTGAALLSWLFRELGFSHEVEQPDRFRDGYGLNVGAIERAHERGIRLVVTVDCGITSFAAAERAQSLGMRLVIVDHHQVDQAKGLPPASAILNPQRADCPSGLRQLCGCGLAFFLGMALRRFGREHGWFTDGLPEPNLRQHLDLVVLATAADMVPLVGDNRILVKHGLETLRHTKKAGLKAMLELAGLGSRELSPGHLGFTLGPRINASGRVQSASLALELLTTRDSDRAKELALKIERLNEERMKLQNTIWDEVRARVETRITGGEFAHGIVVADPGWHEGVVGIVASRVTETFRRPAAVIALREDHGKGSVRSYGGKDVLEALRRSAGTLLGFGGHKHAAGLSLKADAESVRAFELAFDRALAELPEEADAKPLWIEGECKLSDFTLRALGELERLGPFGIGNPEPTFQVRARAIEHRILKQRHLKMALEEEAQVCEALWFNAAERGDVMEHVSQGDEMVWAAVPEINRFRGNVKPSLRIKDYRAE